MGSAGSGATPGNGALRWFVCTEDDVRPGLRWLHPREAARLSEYRFTKRRSEYLLRRTAGKLATAAALGLPAASDADLARIGVLNAVTGAPFVVVDGVDAGLAVSLTDRAGVAIALVAVAPPRSAGTGARWVADADGPGHVAGVLAGIGVDLEIVERRSPAFVNDYLNPGEQVWVRAQAVAAPDGVDAAANLMWSAKESALKVAGVGLRADTRTVDVTVLSGHRPDGWSRVTYDLVPERIAHGVDVPSWWRGPRPAWWTGAIPGWWRRDGAFVLTIATRTPREPPTPLPGSVDLASVQARHSWLASPLPSDDVPASRCATDRLD